MAPQIQSLFIEHLSAGAPRQISRSLAIETPVAVEFNGIGYAVMMMTPADLEDFAYGFARSERLIDAAEDIIDVASWEHDDGVVLRVTLAAACVARVADRVRHRVSESSCGLCGIENLEQALKPLIPVTNQTDCGDPAIFSALQNLGDHQPLSKQTGAVHGAALCDRAGAIRLVKEDVGRHNAFDKLIGAMLRQNLAWNGGFALLTARCSYELVEKAVLANCPLLATISAPTSLAVERAKAAGLRLVSLARSDAFLVPI
jgi:FdhD protein